MEQPDNVLAAVPDARLMVRVWMADVDADYAKQYPDALLQGPTGITDWGGGRLIRLLNQWRRYCGKHLCQLIHRIGQSKYAPHVVGFYIGHMYTGEWSLYKGVGDPGWDYSKTRQDAFRLFLTLKYGSDPNRNCTLPTLEEAPPLADPAL